MSAGHVLVTGGARRIGRAICLELARTGWDVAIHYDQSRSEAESLTHEIRALGVRAIPVQANLSDPDSWHPLVQSARKELGLLTAVVNNASVYTPMTLTQFSAQAWEQTLRVNLSACVGLIHAALDDLQKAKPGRVINICDTLTQPDRPPEKGYLAYGASKSALHWVTRALAAELAPDVLVNGVAPGAAIFPPHFPEDRKARIRRRIPLGIESGPEPIAAAVRFLLNEGHYITGQILAVDGGLGLI